MRPLQREKGVYIPWATGRERNCQRINRRRASICRDNIGHAAI